MEIFKIINLVNEIYKYNRSKHIYKYGNFFNLKWK